MRFSALLAVGLACFALGWFTRDQVGEDAPERAPRRGRAMQEIEIPDSSREEEEAARKRKGPDTAEAPPARVEEAPATAAEGEDEEEESPFRAMLRTQIPQMKAFASMQARQKLAGFGTLLGFDEETEKLIIDAFTAEAERQTEGAYLAMLGEGELDPDSFYYMMGIPGELSNELTRELATFLSDDEIALVREDITKRHEKSVRDMVDMQIRTMQIPELSEDQKVQLRETFAGKNKMQEDMEFFSRVMADPKGLDNLQEEGAIRKLIEPRLAVQRDRMRSILTDVQYESYEKYEASIIQQAEMGLRMMSSMMPRKKEKNPATK